MKAEISAGIGLRAPHMRELLARLPDVDLLEVHTENFFGDGAAVDDLMRVRLNYPVSLHGVGLSIGSSDPLNSSHLAQLQRIIQKAEPRLVSEHLSWGSIDGVYFNDLLPLPYTEEALNHFCDRVVQVQDILGRKILIENPSSYLQYSHSTIPEWEFLTAISQRSGAGILLDVNNVYVSACNLNFDPVHYLESVPGMLVEEIHLGGHTLKTLSDGELRIDDHASPVCESVWRLYVHAIRKIGNRPTIIEWDSELPSLSRLLLEADIARQYLGDHRDVA